MANFAGGSTTNFGGTTPSGDQANAFWVPQIYSKKVQIALRKAAVAEAICNTDSVSYTHLTLPTIYSV